MKSKYFPSMQRATDAQKERLIREINARQLIEPPENLVERKLTTKQIRDNIDFINGLSKETDIVRTRVSGYSKKKKAELLRKARKTLKKKK